MRYFLTYTLFTCCLLFSACKGSSSTDGNNSVDTIAIDTNYDLEEIDTLSTKWDDDFDQLFKALNGHRYIGFPYFMNSDKERWEVSNDVYGAMLLTKATNHEEVLDSLIEWRINKYLAVHNQKITSGKDYDQMNELVKQFRTNNKKDLDLDAEGLDRQLQIIYGSYTTYYFQKTLADMPENQKMSKSLEMERFAWRMWKHKQKELFKALCDGVISANELMELTNDHNNLKTKADLDLYFSLKKANYTTADTAYEHLSDQFAFFDVYNVFIKDIKATGKIGFGKKIQALTAEQKAWQAYIFARRVLSGKLTEHQEEIFDNATNRMQKWHIVQLKNRLKEYRYCSDAFRSSLLKEDCSYPELYKYVPMKLDTQF